MQDSLSKESLRLAFKGERGKGRGEGGRVVLRVGRLTSLCICNIGSLPASYFYLPLGVVHNSLRVWDSIEKRLKK